MKQLDAVWSEGGDAVIVSRRGEELVRHPVTFSRRTHSWLKHQSNGKLATYGVTGIGVLNTIRNGCFRALTCCQKCDRPCYTEDGVTQSGCFSQNTAFAMLRWKQGFNIISNGYTPGTEGFLSIHQPKDGNYDLSIYRPKIWRVASESSTACLDLSLGMTQCWAASNPNKIFAAVSSCYFRVSSHMLRRAAECRNIVAGVSLSCWLGEDDLRNRISEARRYQEHGLPTAIWVATNPVWAETNPAGWKVILDELSTYDPRQVIEVPYHTRAGHTQHILGINPWGGCCQVGIDSCGRQVDMNTGVRLDDGGLAEGRVNGACRTCRNACGASWLKVSST